MLQVELPSYLTRWPQGEIVLKGRRIELFHILDRIEAGDSPSQVAELYELHPDQVRQVIEFAHRHAAEVTRYMHDFRADLARQEVEAEPGPAYLRIRRMMDGDSPGTEGAES